MVYQLMIRKQKYTPINIRNHSGFIIDSNLKQPHLATLREIDLLTTNYSIEEFKKSLIYEGLINSDDYDNKLAIRYKNSKTITLNEGIMYIDDKKYLDENLLEETLKILSNDEEFIRLLLDKYLPKNDGIYNTREYVNLETLKILEAVLDNRIDYYRLRSFFLLYRFLFNRSNIISNLYYCDKKDIIKSLITIFYNNELYEKVYVSGEFDRTIGDCTDHYKYNKNKIQYKRFHSLAYFVCDYEKNKKKIEEEIERQEEFLEPGELSFDDRYLKPEPKTRKKVRKPLEGQLSFL